MYFYSKKSISHKTIAGRSAVFALIVDLCHIPGTDSQQIQSSLKRKLAGAPLTLSIFHIIFFRASKISAENVMAVDRYMCTDIVIVQRFINMTYRSPGAF